MALSDKPTPARPVLVVRPRSDWANGLEYYELSRDTNARYDAGGIREGDFVTVWAEEFERAFPEIKLSEGSSVIVALDMSKVRTV